MKKIILIILLCVNFIYTQVLDEKLYITIQILIINNIYVKFFKISV